MLKITTAVLSKQEITLQLDGRVTGQWVELLRESAKSVLDQGAILNIDLKNISYVDCAGIALMKELIRLGARHLNPPLFIAEQIKKCRDGAV
jgi:ABC-type transporter Mla MlaB component